MTPTEKALAKHGYYAPFRGERSCVVDRAGTIVKIADPRIEGEPARTELSEIFACAVNAQIASERREREAA